MKIQLSFDDYCPENYKLARLLNQHKFKAVFFIDGLHNTFKLAQALELSELGHELGGHTLTHPQDMKELPPELALYEIKTPKTILEDKLKRPIEWFAYPKGRFNEKTKEIVKRVGYKYARTVRVNKWINCDNYEYDTTIHIYPRKEYQGKEWDEQASYLLKQLKDIPEATFHIWGHAWEIRKFNYWERLDDFLIKLKEYDDRDRSL